MGWEFWELLRTLDGKFRYRGAKARNAQLKAQRLHVAQEIGRTHSMPKPLLVFDQRRLARRTSRKPV